MDQIKGKLVNLVLAIQQGRGMGFCKSPLIITATLNGERPMGSDPVDSSDFPQFNTNLLWEIEKKDLKRMRGLNQPLRVEVFDSTSKIGHLQLDLRTAQVLNDIKVVKCLWRKLIVGAKKRNHPELLLGLAMMGGRHQEEEFIKLGEDGDKFLLNFLVKSAANLDLLLPEVLVFGQHGHKYCLEFRIFGNVIRGQEFSEDLTTLINMEDTTSVRLQSTVPQLQKYLVEQENVEIAFYCGTDLLGVGTVDLSSLISQNTLDLVIYLRFSSLNGLIPAGEDGRKPFVNLEVNLVRIEENIHKIQPEMCSSQELLQFSCEVNLRKITWFELKLPKFGLKFLHPQSEDFFVTKSIPIEEKDVIFDSFQVKFLYLATKQTIKSIIKEYPPKIVLLDEDGAEISRKLELDDIEKSFATFVDVKSLEIFAKLLLYLNLTEEVQKNSFNQQILKTESKIVELEEDWERKNQELADEIEKCQLLEQQLQNKVNNLRVLTRVKSGKSEEILQDFRMKFGDCDKEFLVDYLGKLEIDNQKLKEKIEEQQQEMQIIQRTALSKEQTTVLLQEVRVLEEKFDFAQRSKAYFKEQWQKAFEEIHELKNEDYKQMKDRIDESRQELDDFVWESSSDYWYSHT